MRPRGSLRVVGGSAKGRRLKGTLSVEARPTTERVRAAIFNILSRNTYWDRRMLDLYAGSGSLGIEGLSRGAGWADFVEQDSRQCNVIRSNLESTGFSQRSKVYCGEANRTLEVLPGSYSLVVLDPPYKMPNLALALEQIDSTGGLIEENAVVVVGHSRHLDLPDVIGRLILETRRRYGDNLVEFYRRGR